MTSFKQAGFTFVEVLLYIALIGIILIALVPTSLNIIIGSARNSVEQEVFDQARFISEKIKSEVRNSDGINSVNPGSISLSTNNVSTNPTVIEQIGNDLFITQGSGSPIRLHSSHTTVTNLNFTDLSAGGSENIKYSLTLSADFVSNSESYTADITLESSAGIRSN